MPAFLYVRSRAARPRGAARRSRLDKLARRLAPDNIAYRRPIVAERGNEVLTLFNGGSTARRKHTSVCLGSIFGCSAPWWTVGSGAPDGSFAIVRSDGAETELVSDVAGTRTLWYAQNDEQFIVSTSQRAIVMWLESFDCNDDAFAWQLSSGTLGPGLSWDRRIRALPPASRLVFDSRAWSATLHTAPVEYRPSDVPAARQCSELKDAIAETFRGLELDTDCGALALSGGYDSRMILLMLQDRPHLQTVTWGRPGAASEPRNDANIAQQLATKMHTDHSYFELELPPHGVDTVLDRFIRLGEGRTDSISGYIDGFSVWKRLHEAGCRTLLRGDEAFGCRAALTAGEVYRNMKCNVLADFAPESVGRLTELVPPQSRPEHLERRPSESLHTWRDRLNAEFELPYVIGPLNDLKFGYVDVVQPLVSRCIVEQVRGLRDELRTDKRAFKSIVEEVPLDVPFARRVAISPPESVLAHARVLRVLQAQLRRQGEEPGTAGALARHALELLARSNGRRAALRSRFARIVERVRRRSPRAPTLSPLRVAFRTCIIGRMQTLLREDAHALR
jgi:asparagine synthetase B (glutamine-hydrolysing)